jgi:nicotinamidase-related amidase
MKALLVIDMQVGLFEGEPPRLDADGVIRRMNLPAASGRGIFTKGQEPTPQGAGYSPSLKE